MALTPSSPAPVTTPFHAGAGNDLVCGGYGFDTLFGGIDNDALFGQSTTARFEAGGGFGLTSRVVVSTTDATGVQR